MGSERDSTTPISDETVADPDALTCAVCGARIDRTEWHPVRTYVDGDDQFRLDAFCSMACRTDDTQE